MKNRVEMNEMNLNQVTGGYAFSNLLYKNDQKITIGHAILNSDKKPGFTLLGHPKTTAGREVREATC